MQPRDDLRDALNKRSIPQDKFVTIELGQTVSYKFGGVDDKTLVSASKILNGTDCVTGLSTRNNGAMNPV